jgi:PatG Domain
MDQPESDENVAIESEPRAAAAAGASASSGNAIGLAGSREALPAVASARSAASSVAAAQAGTPPCPTCGGVAGTQNGGTASSSYVYALGQIEARFPRPSVEKEMAQATGRAETAGRTDQQAFHQVLSQRENRYLARQMCWVLMIQGLETYILQPRDPADLDLLIGAIEPHESPWISLVIGVRGPIAPPEYCNGLMIPIVYVGQLYTFSRDSLIEAIPRPENIPAEQFAPAARELFDRIMQMTDNAGMGDDRARNYLAVRDPAVYDRTAKEFAADASLTGVEVRPSPLSGTRRVVDCIFCYTNRKTCCTEKYFVRCDVTEEFPFLVTKMSPYYDR